jgi:phosphatidylinositol glycan class V
MLYTLLRSSWLALTGRASASIQSKNREKTSDNSSASLDTGVHTGVLLFRLALPQLALACAALTSFHVQVITRLSSGYPVWYLILAQDFMEAKKTAKWTVRWMVMYAIIQATLFVGFLPPA